MSILLTGGAGYIASRAAAEMLRAGCSAVIAHNFVNSCPEVVSGLKETTGADISSSVSELCSLWLF